ncbi:uncharacterized protein EV420DRAFT_1476148 [Desarmillaria tabescens]|uniref:Uncharacterized protein n=1 Tax=Armillaria tabescens TaxID=1929756 RepID=A0AA39TS74_ARMTA|nr:uncharacterized protein EV420DRAFT_1476148 [Desarmillaria tabescens]KAK0464758.1 hypothetical protein EV420DRAFT_1476148 [Desarmillaria tabescens]
MAKGLRNHLYKCSSIAQKPTLVGIWKKNEEMYFIKDVCLSMIVDHLTVTDTDIKNDFTADVPEDHNEHICICGDVYKHVQGQYTQLLCSVCGDHYQQRISATYTEDLKGKSLMTYESHQEETNKPISLPSIFVTMLQEESKQESEIAREREEAAAKELTEKIDLKCDPNSIVEVSSGEMTLE